jgi:hypothetical protein
VRSFTLGAPNMIVSFRGPKNGLKIRNCEYA